MPTCLSKDVERLLRAVAQLGVTAKDGWVPWPRVARKLEGSAEFTPLVKALADLPEAQPLFSKTEKVVRLSPYGWTVHDELPPLPPEPVTIQIANAVKEYASTLKPLTYRVASVGRGPHVGHWVVQPVAVEAEETFATDTPVTFRSHAGWKTNGKVVGQEPDAATVYVAFQNEIFPDCLPGVLKVDRAYLLHSLATRLQGLKAMPQLASSLMNRSGQPTAVALGERDAVLVADRLADLPAPWARFLWGPPGAGKTYGIGRLLARLLQQSPAEQHLVVAPSNRAVDVAVLQFLKHCEGIPYLENLITARRLLRFGYPRKPEVMDRPELLGPVSLDKLTTAVRELSRRLRQAERTHEPEEELATIRAELLTVQEELRNAVHTHIRQSAVVFTTSTLAYLGSESNPVGDMGWSSVLVDEVTMVPPAQCVFLGSLARSRFLLGGDPRQLGPIFESQSASSHTIEWMGRDVFEKSQISEGNGEARKIHLFDTRLSRIDAQRRCCKGIWRRVEALYPRISSSVDEQALKWLSDLPPASGQPVVLLDTSALAAHGTARCERAHESWRNIVSAEIAMEVACAIVGEAGRDLSVAIIAPYRAQVRLLRKWLRQEARSENPAYRNIEAGTVHQFQGSDADVVVFDVVDGEGRTSLGTLLRDDTGLRLVTVAITRARGKAVIIADASWLRRAAHRGQNPLLWDLVLCEGPVAQVQVAPPTLSDERDACESPIEAILLAAMRKQPVLVSVVTQFQIRDGRGALVSRADFAFPELKYAVYCDGAEWHLQHDRWQKDLRQRNRLAELGWMFTVFTGAEVKRDPTACAEQVARTYERRREGAPS